MKQLFHDIYINDTNVSHVYIYQPFDKLQRIFIYIRLSANIV